MIKTSIAFLSLLLCFSAPGQAVRKPHIEVELVTAQNQVQHGQTLLLGLRLKMEPGWHVYWRNPGDSGEPTRIDWNLPMGFAPGPIQWPAPKRLPVPPLVNFGYEGEVFLLTEILPGPKPPGIRTADIEANASWLVCKEQCIPGEAKLKINLPWSDGPKAESKWRKTLEDVRRQIPAASPAWRAERSLSGEQITLSLIGNTNGIEGAEFYPFSELLIQHAADQKFRIDSNRISLQFPRSPYAESSPPANDEWAGVVVLKGENGSAIEVLPTVAGAQWGKLWEALLFAFLGGVLLNLMPCVFPVLCLKVLSFSQLAGAQRKKAVHHSLAYTLGILASFWALAGSLIALRAGGQALGWGFQLQSPIFIAALCFLLVGMSLNLFGVFEIGGSWMGVGQKYANKEGASGAFFSGVLATIVATPCTAPFMGTAMGYALSQPAYISLGVFTFLGLGLACPYVVFSAFPTLTVKLPRPGQWMVTFKQLMAFPLLVTAWWLLWVLSFQSASDTVLAILLALIVFSMGLWIFGLHTKKPWIRLALSFLFVSLSLGWAANQIRNAPAATVRASTGEWQPYSESALQSALASQRPVFLDFTAAWCITCQVNERVALDTPEVQARFKEKQVVLFKADWTNQDEAIAKKLESYGRNGVPLYVLYVPGKKEPQILPQLLTPDIVLSALDTIGEEAK